MSFRLAAIAMQNFIDTDLDIPNDRLADILRRIFDTVYDVTIVLTGHDHMGCDEYSVLKTYWFIDADEAAAFAMKIEAGDHDFEVPEGGTINVYRSSRKLFPHHYTEIDPKGRRT